MSEYFHFFVMRASISITMNNVGDCDRVDPAHGNDCGSADSDGDRGCVPRADHATEIEDSDESEDELRKCRNHFCETLTPWESCMKCTMTYGRIESIDVVDDCDICGDPKSLYLINCGLHKLCLDCIANIIDRNHRCPLCWGSMW